MSDERKQSGETNGIGVGERGSTHGFVQSFGYAFHGIAHAFSSQFNFRVQVCIALVAIVLGFALRIDQPDWLAIIICIGLVLGGECVNTALEAAVDLASPEYHDLARHAKDCAAGAVLVASFASLAIACLIFLPRLYHLFL